MCIYSIRQGGFRSKHNPNKPSYKVYSKSMSNWLSMKEVVKMGLPDPAMVLGR